MFQFTTLFYRVDDEETLESFFPQHIYSWPKNYLAWLRAKLVASVDSLAVIRAFIWPIRFISRLSRASTNRSHPIQG